MNKKFSKTGAGSYKRTHIGSKNGAKIKKSSVISHRLSVLGSFSKNTPISQDKLVKCVKKVTKLYHNHIKPHVWRKWDCSGRNAFFFLRIRLRVKCFIKKLVLWQQFMQRSYCRMKLVKCFRRFSNAKKKRGR